MRNKYSLKTVFLLPSVESIYDLPSSNSERANRKQRAKGSFTASSALLKSVPAGISPDSEITNGIGKREISTDKSNFKQYSPSYQKTSLKFEQGEFGIC